MSEANRTCGRGSGNIANPSKSENCQDNFQDLQKDLVVLLVLMLRLTSPSATRPPLLKGEALSKNTLSGIFTNKKALLLGELAACTPERSKIIKSERDPSVVGEPLPRLFSPDTVEKRFGCAAIFAVSPYLTNISPLRSG